MVVENGQMTKEFRLDRYLGTLSDINNHMFRLNEDNIKFNIKDTLAAPPTPTIEMVSKEFIARTPYSVDDYFGLCKFGDLRSDIDFYGLVKARSFIRNQKCNGVISFINGPRHWNPVTRILNQEIKDTPWSEKQNKMIWRGGQTDIFSKANPRAMIVRKFYNHKDIDVGFNRILWTGHPIPGHVKPTMSIEEMLTYKYIISLEGHDVATNLQWIMCSNSLAIMPMPTRESWFLESCLIPWVHFVPINSTMDDLEEKLEWCLANDDKCQQIVRNANEYVSNFLNTDKEKELSVLVIKSYFDRLTFICDSSLRNQYGDLLKNKKNVVFD